MEYGVKRRVVLLHDAIYSVGRSAKASSGTSEAGTEPGHGPPQTKEIRSPSIAIATLVGGIISLIFLFIPFSTATIILSTYPTFITTTIGVDGFSLGLGAMRGLADTSYPFWLIRTFYPLVWVILVGAILSIVSGAAGILSPRAAGVVTLAKVSGLLIAVGGLVTGVQIWIGEGAYNLYCLVFPSFGAYLEVVIGVVILGMRYLRVSPFAP